MDSPGFHRQSIDGRGKGWTRPSPFSFKRPPFWERVKQTIVHAWQWLVHLKRTLGWPRFIGRAIAILFLLLVLYLGFLWLTLPNLDDPTSLFAAQSTVITDRNGIELYRLYSEQDRTYIPADQISPWVKKAIVAIEDQRFYNRGCLDTRALARAVLSFGHGGGASTLTRQLARNALDLQHENIFSRKLKELILGCQMESKYSKDKILELYLNWIPFGQSAYGVEQASKRFFGGSAKDLTLAQSAILASLPQLPTYFSPYGKHVHTTVSDSILKKIAAGTITQASQIPANQVKIGLLGGKVGTGSHLVDVGGRADQVLANMEAQGLITEQERVKATKELLTMTFKPLRESIRAPHFVLWVKDQVEQMYENADKNLLEQGGLTIQTTLDWRLQQAAEKAVADHRDDTLKRFGARNIALVALDPKTRDILAYVGNSDYSDELHDGKVDMVQAPRQPGSSFKPFVYATAFLQGYSPSTVLFDVPTKFGPDQPQNYDGTFWGLTTMRKALGGSRNVPAVKTFFLAGGEEQVLDTAAKLGVTAPRDQRDTLRLKNDFSYGWPLAIGAAETPLIQMVEGYSTFAYGGVYEPVNAIDKITSSKGALLYEAARKQQDQAIDPRIAYQITSVLSDSSARPGEFWQQALAIPGYQVAAKTGTSNKCLTRSVSDSTCTKRKPDSLWTLGYTPDLAAGVWVGNANSEALADKADGLNVAAPVWKQFMISALKTLQAPTTTFVQPPGIVQAQISLLSGGLPTGCTPVNMRATDVFLQERLPSTPDSACLSLTVDKVTGLLASDECPLEAQEQQSFFAPKSELPDRWPLWEQAVQTWAHAGTGAQLPLPLAPTQKCDPSLTPGRLEKPAVSIVSPSNGGTANYPSFQATVQYTIGSAVKQVVYSLDGKVVDTETTAPFKGIIRVPRSVSKSGSHTLSVTLTDQYFNEASDSVTFTFGETVDVPQVQMLSPPNGSLLSGSGITLRASADSQGGIKYVEFFLDATLLSRKPKEPYELIYPLSNISSGVHTFRAVATDYAGKTSEDSVTVTAP